MAPRADMTLLLAEAQNGDSEKREEILTFLRARLMVLAKQRVMEEDAPDLVQDALVVIHEHFPDLTSVPRLIAFSNSVLANKIGNYYRKRDRRGKVMTVNDDLCDSGYDLGSEMAATELAWIVERALRIMEDRSPRCRTLLQGLIDGRSIQDLSRQFNRPRARIDEWLFHCRQKLRRLLDERFGVRFR